MDPDDALSPLNVAINALNLAKEAIGVTLTKAALGSVSVLLTAVRVDFLLATHFCRLLANGYGTR